MERRIEVDLSDISTLVFQVVLFLGFGAWAMGYCFRKAITGLRTGEYSLKDENNEVYFVTRLNHAVEFWVYVFSGLFMGMLGLISILFGTAFLASEVI